MMALVESTASTLLPSRKTQIEFNHLLSRADEDLLQTLLSRPAVKLLVALDERGVTAARLRRTLLAQRDALELMFDPQARGELLSLLRPEEARRLAAALGLPQHNVYDTFAKMRLTKGSQRARSLIEFFGLVEPQDEAPVEPPPSWKLEDPKYGLFRHQRRAIFEIRKHFKRSDARVLLHMPTGSGKTRTAMNVIAEHLRATEPTTVVWLATSEELCEQAAQEFESAWRQLGNRPISVHRYWGDRTLDVTSLSDAFVVAGLGKTYSAATRNPGTLARLGDATSLIVVDEAHQSTAATYSLVINALFARRPGRSSLLGLTATPGRTWADLDQDEELARFFNRTKVVLQVEGFPNPVEYLITKQYLARPKFTALEWSGELSEEEERDLSESLDVPRAILQRLAEDELRNVRILRAIDELVPRHQRIILFAATVDHAILLSAVLQARGVDARAITGTTSKRERRETIDWYKDGGPVPKVLCNFGVLTAGFDAPRTSCALIARPTLSLVLFSQMVGRATRGPRAGGNAEAEILTVVDTSLPGFRSIAESFMNWEDVWS